MKLTPFNMQALNGKNIFLDGISWNEDGFIITCLDENPASATIMGRIIFPPDVLNVRITHEYQSWKIDEQISEWLSQANSELGPVCCFFLDASEYINWYKSIEAIDSESRLQQLLHFFFFVDDTLIEVIEDRFPTVTFETLSRA